jgi:hypothetical protein
VTFLKGKKQILAALLASALLIPAESAFANDWTKPLSRTRGGTIGAAAGAFLGPAGAVAGAALGNGVQYARRSTQHYSRHHHHYYRRW